MLLFNADQLSYTIKDLLLQALVKRTPSSGADSQSAVPPSPFATGEMDEAQDDTEGSSSGKVSSLAAGTSSSVGASTAGLGVASGGGGTGGNQDSGALTSKSVEALAKQLEVCYKYSRSTSVAISTEGSI